MSGIGHEVPAKRPDREKGTVRMDDDNKRNIQYFEAASMRALYEIMDGWQEENRKRLHSVSIQHDAGQYCCIALTNPTEVVIVSQLGYKVGVEKERLLVDGG
jgi:hypothetical protein